MKGVLEKPLGGRVLADQVTTSLREAIASGQFEPGEKVDQNQLAQDLGVSLTPVREALKALQFEGFVVLRPHRGAFIVKISPRDIHEIYEVRKLLETEVVRHATPLMPDSVLAGVESYLAETRTRFEAGDGTVHFESDVQFHETIASYEQNALMRELLAGLSKRILAIRRFALGRPGPHLMESWQEHSSILLAIRQRDADQAADLMWSHLDGSAQRLAALAE